MRCSGVRGVILVASLLVATVIAWGIAKRDGPKQVPSGEPSLITVDYPAEGSLFPPEFPALAQPRSGYWGNR